MKVTEIRQQLETLCSPHLKGWSFRKAHNWYAKRIPLGEQRYLIRLVARGGEVLVELSCGVRISKIEEVFHRTSGIPRDYQNDSAALWTAIQDLASLPSIECEPKIVERSDVESAASTIVDLFRRFAEPFFAENQDVESVDRVLNSRPDQPSTFTAPNTRAFYGLVAAALVHRSDFDSLVETYRSNVRKWDRGADIARFDTLAKDLRSNVLHHVVQ